MSKIQVEQTGKRYKLAVALAWLLLIAGGVLAMAGYRGNAPTPAESFAMSKPGLYVVAASVVLWLYGKLGGWWSHG